MDWSKAKTIFIITFFVLDIFLVYHLINQRKENTFDLIQETSIEQQMEADGIKMPNLPTEPKKDFYVKAEAKKFKKDELSELPNQKVVYYNDGIFHSVLVEPYPLKADWKVADINQFVNIYTYEGSQYRFWKYDKKNNTIIYYQLYKNKLFYNNSYAKIEIQLNEENEIISYKQAMMENMEEMKEQEIITAYDALLILYNKRLLKSDEHIEVNLGYYNLIPDQSTQLLAPTWHFTIGGDTDYFVNAIEGHVFTEEREVLE